MIKGNNDDDSMWSTIQQAKKKKNNFYNTNENNKKQPKYKKIEIISPMFGRRSFSGRKTKQNQNKLADVYGTDKTFSAKNNTINRQKSETETGKNTTGADFVNTEFNSNSVGGFSKIPEWLTTELEINKNDVGYQSKTTDRSKPKSNTEDDEEDFMQEYSNEKKMPLFD